MDFHRSCSWVSPTDARVPRGWGGRGSARTQKAEERRHPPEIHQEHVLDLLQDFQLSEHIANLVSFDALLFVHVLHGIHLLGVSLLHNTHLKHRRRAREKTFSEMFHILMCCFPGLRPALLTTSTPLPNTPEPWAAARDGRYQQPRCKRSAPGRCTIPPRCLSPCSHKRASPGTWRPAPGRAFRQGMVSGGCGGELRAHCLCVETGHGPPWGFSPSLDSIPLTAAGCQPPADWF